KSFRSLSKYFRISVSRSRARSEFLMRHIGGGKILLAVTLSISSVAWGQGRAGRAAAAQQQGAPANAQGNTAAPAEIGRPGARGGRGGADVGAAASEFFNFDTNAGSIPAIQDMQLSETHQKITVNGEALAYTARAGYLPLRNATTGQAEAYIFYTA